MKVCKTISYLLTGLVAFSVSSSIFASSAPHKHHGSKMKTANARASLSAKDKKQILAVFQANEALHAAFISFEVKKVNAQSHKVAGAIAKIENPQIKKLLSFSEKKLIEMSSTSSNEDLSKHYNLVSMALIHILKSYDIGKGYDAYSCPMVKKKWVQNSLKTSKVHNPYAASMPHCGSKDTKFSG